MDFSSLLNEDQLKGVVTSSQYVRVIAGAGSGKTRVLTYRIAHLIINCNVLPYQILAMTFTNKAAKEIKERVSALVDSPNTGFNMYLGTIHSWCAMFLRKEIKALGYPTNFTILDDEDQLAVMKEIFVKHGYTKSDSKIKMCLNWIGSKKTDGFEYEDLKDKEYPNSEIKLFVKYYGEYTEILKQRNSLDFDDLLLKSIDVLANFPLIREKYCRYIRYILVDEFQDINDVQFNLIRLLMDAGTSLYVVGDPDQTIYTWRGANNRIILNLEESLKEINSKEKLETIMLIRNYRSTKMILDCANNLIVNNKERVKKDLIPVNDSGDMVDFFNARTAKEETHHIVSTILELHKFKNVKYKDIVVLYRANYLTRELESTLSSYRVPYKVYGGMKFFQRREIKDLLAYFRLIVNDLDDTAFDRIINVPRRGIGPLTIDRISALADENGQTKFSYISENLNEAPFTTKQRALVTDLVLGVKQIRNEIESNSQTFVQSLYDFINLKLGYFDYLKEDDDTKYDERKDNIEELFSSLKSQMEDNPNLSFEEFVNSAMLQSSQDEVNEGDYVSLMTVHTAKGLEYDYVFVYSLGQGIFPSLRSITESRTGIEEERRLAYVAFTRAKKKLYLSSNQDYSFTTQGPLSPSQFVKEAGIKIGREISHNIGVSSFKPQGFVKKDIAPKPQNDMRLTNGIKDWKVGDKVVHEKFGEGVVVEIISQLIVVKFNDPGLGKKTFLGSHISIKRI